VIITKTPVWQQLLRFLPCSVLELECGEDELVDGAAGVVDEVHQLAVVRPGLQLPREQPERRVLRSGNDYVLIFVTGSAVPTGTKFDLNPTLLHIPV
jgi:hypothetical protein